MNLETAARSQANQYAELKRIVKQRGLMIQQLAYFAGKFALTLGMLAVTLCLLLAFDSTWLQLLNAAFWPSSSSRSASSPTIAGTGSFAYASLGRTTRSPSSSATSCSA